MKESAKFKQANKEARATVVATVLVILFWCVAGFGLADSNIMFLHTPLWVWGGCIGTWIFSVVVAVVLARYVFMDMSLDADKEEKDHE